MVPLLAWRGLLVHFSSVLSRRQAGRAESAGREGGRRPHRRALPGPICGAGALERRRDLGRGALGQVRIREQIPHTKQHDITHIHPPPSMLLYHCFP